jgi:L-rhamnose mutarotase
MHRRSCLALDLQDDPQLVAEYEAHHRAVWPEILASLRQSGVESMEIYRLGTRLMMIMEVADGFSFERKSQSDQAIPRVREWEALMWKYQKAVPGGPAGAKWQVMDRIFVFPAVD